MTGPGLIEGFLAGTLDPERFHHRHHVEVAWRLLREHPPAEALALLSAGLRRLATRAGRPERYHETITTAYLFLTGERMAAQEGASRFEEFAERNPDLLSWRPSVLERYYSAEALESDLARRVFLLPRP